MLIITGINMSASPPHFSSPNSGLKRPAEAVPVERPYKKSHLEWSGVYLVTDIVHKILSYLPFQSLLKFEKLSRTCRQYTKSRWKELTIEERLDFDWSACAKAIDSVKYRYILGRATLQYAEERFKVLEELKIVHPSDSAKEKLQRIYHRFEGLMVRFPSFGAFLWNDLSRISNNSLTSQLQKSFLMSDINEPCETGGELLLRGLSQLGPLQTIQDPPLQPLRRKAIGEAFQTLTKAIQKNATCASFLAVRLFFNRNLQGMLINLSILSIGKNNDCRGLDQLLSINPEISNGLFTNGNDFPPVLVAVAKHGGKTTVEKEQLLATAIIGYGDHVPAETWHTAADVKYNLQKWKDAAELYSKAITAYGDNVPPEVLSDAAFAYHNLQQWEKAAEFYSKAITAYGDNVLPVVLHNAAVAYHSLQQWEKAAELSTKAITAYGENVLPVVLKNAATAYFKLQLWEKAAELYSKAITAYEDNVPPVVLTNAATAYFELQQWGKAAEFYIKAITAYGDNVPPRVLQSAAVTYHNLEQWEKAAELYTKGITAYGANVPPQVLHNAALAYLYLKQWEKVAEFYSKAITAYGDKVPPEVLSGAALAYLKLKQWEKAAELYTKAITAYGENVSPKFLHSAAIAYFNLKQWEKAAEFYTKAITAYGDNVPPQVLKNAAVAYHNLQQ